MKIHFSHKEESYDGRQLRPLFNYTQHGILGDSLVGWIGSCQIHFDQMIDAEDVVEESQISGKKMLHFILEKFNCSLLAAVGIQRLMSELALDTLLELADDGMLIERMHRDGDDLYLGERKFNISIATVCPTSALIHFAVNIVNEGTPVPTCALNDFKVEPEEFARTLMEKVQSEILSMEKATQKVRPAHS